MIRAVFALARAPRGRLALATALASATILAGVGLMSFAGYLISRAAEQPSVLSLTVAIVGVRFFGLARPIARYFERLASHDLAFRALGRARVRVYERVEPLAPAELGGYRRGDLLSRVVADVDALQYLHLRGLVPALAAVVAGAVATAVTAALLPWAAVVLAVGLLCGGVGVPAGRGGARTPGGTEGSRVPRRADRRARRAALGSRRARGVRARSRGGGTGAGGRPRADPARGARSASQMGSPTVCDCSSRVRPLSACSRLPSPPTRTVA